MAVAAERLADKLAAIREHLGDETASLRRVAGTAHWNPESLPHGMEPGLGRDRLLRGAEPPPARRRGSRRLLCSPRIRGRRRRGRDRSRDRRDHRPRLRDRPRRGPASEPAPRRGAGARRLRTRRGGGALRAARLGRATETSSPASFMDYLCPTAPDLPTADDRPPGVAVAVPAARSEGARRGHDDERAGGDRERRRRRARPRRRRACRSLPAASGSCSQR